MERIAMSLLALWMAPRVAMKIWWAITPIILIGVGISLYSHDSLYSIWGFLIALVIIAFATIDTLLSLNGTGWIPPRWFITLLEKKNG